MAETDLHGKRAIVTGGASGIGLACVREFRRRGAHVIVADHHVYQTEAVAEELGAEPWIVDLADTAALEDVRLDADILVNNVGMQRVDPIAEFSPEDFRHIQRLMVESPFLLIRATLPGMSRRGWGRIVNISSVHGLRASAFKSAYVTAKHALEGLSKVTALEGARFGVTSNCVNPAYVRTPLVERQITDQARVHGIGDMDLHVLGARSGVSQDRFQPWIDLERDYPGTGRRQSICQCPGSRPHLEDGRSGAGPALLDDLPGDVGVRQEVLAEAVRRRYTVTGEQLGDLGSGLRRHRRNTLVAFSVVIRATSTGSMPQTAARASPLRATQAGSLGSPRWGGGARYGVSVSTKALSCGTRAAPRRTVSPVSNAIGPANENMTPSSRKRRVHRRPPVQQWRTVRGPAPVSSRMECTSPKASRQ